MMKQLKRVRARPAREGAGETPAAAFRDAARCQRVVGTLSLLANERRLRILCTLLDSDRSVAEIVNAVGGSFSGVSQQLKLLTLAGHLARRRSEKSVIYRLADPGIARILHFLKNEFPSE